MLDYIANIKPSIELGNTDPYIFDEFYKDIKLASYDYDYIIQKDLIDYYEYEFIPEYNKSYIEKDVFGIANSGDKHSYTRIIEFNIKHRFIIQGEMENYKKSSIFNKYIDLNTITSNLKFFHYNLLVYIDDELYTDFKIKPERENVSIIFKTQDLNTIHKRHVTEQIDSISMPNKIKVLFLPNAIISTIDTLSTTISNNKIINASSITNINLFTRVNKYIAFFVNKITGDNFLYTISNFDITQKRFTTVDNVPGTIGNFKLVIIGMNEIRNIVNINQSTTWFTLPEENMPVPKSNIMIFIKKGNVDSYIPNDNTVELTEYYPNIYKVTNPNNYNLRLILLYEEKELNSHIVYDDEIKLYRDKVDLFNQYKENNVPKLISEYKPISWDYSYNHLFSKVGGYNKLNINNLNQTNAYKTDVISSISKKWYKFYDEYQRRTYNGFLSGWYHNIGNYTSEQLSNKIRNNFNEDVDEYDYADDFSEEHYVFSYKNNNDDIEKSYLWYIDGKLVFPTKVVIDKTFQYVYFPKSKIKSTSIIEVERFDGVVFEKKLKISKTTGSEGFVSFTLKNETNLPIIANSLFLVKETGEFVDQSKYDLRIHDTKLGALYLDTNNSTYKISPDQTLMIFPKENAQDLYNTNLLLCCNNKIVYYDEEEDGTFFTSGNADKVNLNKNFYIHKVKQDSGGRIRIYSQDGRLIPKRGYTIYKYNNYYDGPKFNVVIHGDKKEKLTVVYIGYDEKVIYHRDNLPKNGFVSIEGRTSRPLNFAYHDLYLDGYRLTKYDIEQISPFKFIIKNYEKYDTNITLEIYEKSTPTDSYIKYRYNEFSDYTMDLVIDDNTKNINKSDILDTKVKNNLNTDKVSFKDIIEAGLSEYSTNYSKDIIDSIHDDYMDLLRYYSVYKYMNGDKRVDLEAFYHIFNDIGRAVLNADDRVKYEDDVSILYYLNHNLALSNNTTNNEIPDRNLTKLAVIPDVTISIDESTYMKNGYIDNNFSPVYNEPFIPHEEVVPVIELTKNPTNVTGNVYDGLKEDYPIIDNTKIRKYTIPRPILLQPEIYYSGNEETVLLAGYNADFMIIDGYYKATNINNYRANVKPKEGYVWEDTKTSETIYFNWSIVRRPLHITDIPVAKDIVNYTGDVVEPEWVNYNESVLDISGDVSGIEIGEYSADFTPTENTYWADGTEGAKSSKWEIGLMAILPPVVTGTYVYDENKSQEVRIINYDSSKMTIEGTYIAKNAGTYSVILTPIGSYVWADTLNRNPRELEWTIQRKPVSSEILPTQTNELHYIYYKYQSPTWSEYNTTEIYLVGNPREINLSTDEGHIAKFAPTSNYCWSDGTFEGRNAYWQILPNEIDPDFNQVGTYVYNGKEYEVIFDNYNPDTMFLLGDTSKIDAGEYTALIRPQYGYVWSTTKDTSDYPVKWYINRQPFEDDTLPKQINIPIYDKRTHEVEFEEYDKIKLTLGGVTSESQISTGNGYAATFTPTDNYCWSDGSYDSRIAYWKINPAKLGTPYQIRIHDYDATEQTVELALYSEDTMDLYGTYKATNANTYIALVKPKIGYVWRDNDGTEEREIKWIIRRRPVASDTLPTQIVELIYKENTYQKPTWSEYSKDELTAEEVSGIDAGTYTCTFTPTDNYCWIDRTFEPKTTTWEIKRQPFIDDTLPSQLIELYYIDDTNQYPTWTTYSTTKLQIDGTLVGQDAGKYNVTFQPTSNYCWSNGTTDPRGAKWVINKQPLEISELPTQAVALVYKEDTEQSPTWSEYSTRKLTAEEVSGLNAGTYTCTFTPTDNYCWADGSEYKTVEWIIDKQPLQLTELPTQATDIVYEEGVKQSPTWTEYSTVKLTIGGDLEETNAGSYIATFTPTDNYCWFDDSEYKTVEWVIDKQPLQLTELPTQANMLYFLEETVQSPTWTEYSTVKLTAEEVSGIDAGSYICKFTPTDNYKWFDDSEYKTVTWTIIESGIDEPYQINIPTYDGTLKRLELANYEEISVTLTNDTTGTDAGTYTVTCTPKTGYRWNDTKTNEPRNIHWVINRQPLVSDTLPTQSNTLTYIEGTQQGVEWTTYDTVKLQAGGTQSGINATTYTATFRPTDNYCWSDGTTGARNATWTINRQPISESELPEQAEPLYYTYEEQSPTWTEYNKTKLTLGGKTSATLPLDPTDTGYAATFTPTSNYCWEDGTFGPKIVYWRINYGLILEIPYQINIPTYTKGTEWTAELALYNPDTMTLTGELSAVNAGTHYISVTPKPGFVWEDTEQAEIRVIIWLINRRKLASYDVPTQTNTLTYNGELQSPTWTEYDTDVFIKDGVLNATNAGTYEATFTPTENYCWPNGKWDFRISKWIINKRKLPDETLPTQINTLYYNRDVQYPEWSEYDDVHIAISGDISGVNAKTYTASFTPIANYCWSNETNGARTVNWVINRQRFTDDSLPSQNGKLTYTGSPLTVVWTEYDTEKLKAGGTLTATNVSEDTYYTATFTPTDNYAWSDGTYGSKPVQWQIERAVADLPKQINVPTYDGNEHTVELENFDETIMSLSGTLTKTNAGTYTALVTPINNYCWSDTGISNTRIVIWEIYKQVLSISLPSQATELTYNGSDQTVTWTDYDTSKLTKGGTQSGTNAGTYSGTFTPTANYCWSMSGNHVPNSAAKSVNWTIKRKPVDSDELPYQTNDLTFNGATQYVTWSPYDSAHINIGGTTFAVNASTGNGYAATFTPIDNYCWSNGSTSARTAYWTIKRQKFDVDTLPQQKLAIYYNGKSQTVTWTDYDTTKLAKGGVQSAINVSGGNGYKATFAPTSNYLWSDGTYDPRPVYWKIFSALLEVDGEYVYNGNPQTVTIIGFDEGTMNITNNTYTDAGKYKAIISWKSSDFVWNDTLTNTPKEVEWEIYRQPIGNPTISQTNTLTYTGSSQSPEFDYDPDPAQVTVGGTLSGVNATSYTATFTPTANYCWGVTASKNPNTGAKSVTWKINRKVVSYETIPVEGERRIYNTGTQYPDWNTDGFNTTEVTIGGTTSAVNATDGQYTVTFTPTSNYCWSDGTTGSKSANWHIDRRVVSNEVLPEQTEIPRYTGSTLYPGWTHEMLSTEINFTGNHSAVNANMNPGYSAIFTPNSNHCWSDHTYGSKSVNWKIDRAFVYESELPKQDGIIFYDGESHTVTWTSYDRSKFTVGGKLSDVQPSTGKGYAATFTPTSNYCWEDETYGSVTVYWKIVVSKLIQINIPTYDGNEHEVDLSGFAPDIMVMSNVTRATNAGTYIVTVSLKDNYIWSDSGESSPRDIEWIIYKQQLGENLVLEQSVELTYNGNVQYPTWTYSDETKLTIGGTLSATNANTNPGYAATFKPKDNYCWYDKTDGTKTVYWKINRQKLTSDTLPEQTNVLTYNGSSQSPTWSSYDTTKLALGGTTSAVNASTSHAATFTPTSNYAWSNGTTTSKTAYWTINKKKLESDQVPSQNGVCVYDGTRKTPSWNNYNPNILTINGTTSAVEVSTGDGYIVTFTPTSNYLWSDGTNGPKTVYWKLIAGKLQSVLVVSDFTYDGSVKEVELSGFDPTYMTLEGTTSAINAGTYKATVKLIYGYVWSENGGSDDLELEWEIKRQPFTSDTLPSQINIPTYDGSTHTVEFSSYDTNKLTIGGTLSASVPATGNGYAATFTPTSNYAWSDGTYGSKTVYWNIGKRKLDSDDLPYQTNSLTYNGQVQSPTWSSYDTNKLTIGGTLSATNASMGYGYAVTFTPTNNYTWTDGTTNARTTYWTIAKAKGTIKVKIVNPDTGEIEEIEIEEPVTTRFLFGTKSITYKPGDSIVVNSPNVILRLDSSGPIDLTNDNTEVVNIRAGTVSEVPEQYGKIIYNGERQYVTWDDNFNDANMYVSGTTSGINVGEYTAYINTRNGWTFADKTTTKEVKWYIDKAEGIIELSIEDEDIELTEENNTLTLTVYSTGEMTAVSKNTDIVVINPLHIETLPSQSNVLTYDGNQQSVEWDNYNTEQLTVSGQIAGTNAGTYTATFTCINKWTFSDGSTSKDITWVIGRQAIDVVPTQDGTVSYNGNNQSPTWVNYDSNKLTISGDTSGINADTYTAIFTPTSNYKWYDDTTTGKTSNWVITESRINLPEQAVVLTYNGNEQNVTWDNNYDTNKMSVSGISSATDAGTYTATFTLTDNTAKWYDGTTTPKDVNWTINKAEGIIETNLETIEITEDDDYILLEVYATGEISATIANTSIATFTQLLQVPSQVDNLTYNGQVQSPTWSSYDSNKLSISGTSSATDAGTYTATFTPLTGFSWSDSTDTAKNSEWTIQKQNISVVPVQDGELYSNGTTQSPDWTNYDSNKLTIGGTSSASNPGTYTATFTPTNNYKWSDGSTSKNVEWTILNAKLNIPSQSNVLTYNGNAQSPTWDNYDSTKMTKSGTDSEIYPGTYENTFSLISNTDMWIDDTTENKVVNWSISKAEGIIELENNISSIELTEEDNSVIITVYSTGPVTAVSSDETIAVVRKVVDIPSQSANQLFVYNGEEHSPTFDNFDTDAMSLSGISSAVNAGSYSAVFVLNEDYVWSDNTTEDKVVNWSISKADGIIQIGNGLSSIELDSSTPDVVLTIYTSGYLTAVQGNSNVAKIDFYNE